MRRDHARALEAADRDLARLGRSPVTRKDLALVARAFFRAVSRPLDKIDKDDVRVFLADCRTRGLAPCTQAGYLGHLRMFFAALERCGLVASNPTEGISLPRAEPRPYRLLSEQDVAKLFAAALDVPEGYPIVLARARRDRATLELLYGLALRSSEVRAARVLDLDLCGGTLLVRRAKNGQPERLSLPPTSVPQLRAYLDTRPLLARGGRDEGRLLLTNEGLPFNQPSAVNKLLTRVANRAGVWTHPHALRRGVATHLVRAGAPILAVQDLLGHAQLGTTAIYVQVERHDLRRAIDTLDRTRNEPDASSAGGATPP